MQMCILIYYVIKNEKRKYWDFTLEAACRDLQCCSTKLCCTYLNRLKKCLISWDIHINSYWIDDLLMLYVYVISDIVLHTYAYLISRDIYEQELYFRSFVMCYSILIIVKLRQYNLSNENFTNLKHLQL